MHFAVKHSETQMDDAGKAMLSSRYVSAHSTGARST
jgi:hypothetical protein